MSLYGKAMLEEFPWLHVGFMVFCRFYFPFYLCLLIGQEPTLKTILNKIGDEIIVVNELLNKLELEIQYQEQTNSSLKVMVFLVMKQNKKGS